MRKIKAGMAQRNASVAAKINKVNCGSLFVLWPIKNGLLLARDTSLKTSHPTTPTAPTTFPKTISRRTTVRSWRQILTTIVLTVNKAKDIKSSIYYINAEQCDQKKSPNVYKSCQKTVSLET